MQSIMLKTMGLDTSVVWIDIVPYFNSCTVLCRVMLMQRDMMATRASVWVLSGGLSLSRGFTPSASKAIFSERTYIQNLFGLVMMIYT